MKPNGESTGQGHQRHTRQVSDFRLKPYEDVMGGVRYGNGRLRLKPSGAAEALDLYGLAVTLILGVLAVMTMNVVLGLAVVPTAVLSCRFLRCRVTAGDHKITVTNKWRQRCVEVAEVAEAKIQTFRPGWGFLPFAGPTTIWPRTFSAGVLVLRDGTEVRADALVGLPRSRGDTIATPVEAKVGILQRWIEAEHASLA